MPLYTYRREDGTTFDMRQGFNDEALTVDPETGQRVVRIVQPAPVIFKGSGFYVNDSRGKSASTLSSTSKKTESSDKAESTTTASTDTAKPAATTSAAAD